MKRRIITRRRALVGIGGAALLAAPAIVRAQTVITPSPVNPYQVFDADPVNPGWNDLTGKTASTFALTGETTALFILFGQSNGGNHIGAPVTPYVPVNPTKIDNVNIYNRTNYRSNWPMLGNSGNAACWMPQVQDALVSRGTFQRVIVCSTSIAGVPLTAYNTGNMAYKLINAVLACRLFLMPITAFIVQQGESGPSTTAGYKTQMDGITNAMQGMGVTAPFFYAKSTMNGGVVDSLIQTAIDQQVAAFPAVYKLGANTDSLGTNSNGVTISNGSPGVVTWTSHPYSLNSIVVLQTTGVLPAPLQPFVAYYVVPINANSFSLAATRNGAAINTTTAGSGSHTAGLFRMGDGTHLTNTGNVGNVALWTDVLDDAF